MRSWALLSTFFCPVLSATDARQFTQFRPVFCFATKFKAQPSAFPTAAAICQPRWQSIIIPVTQVYWYTVTDTEVPIPDICVAIVFSDTRVGILFACMHGHEYLFLFPQVQAFIRRSKRQRMTRISGVLCNRSAPAQQPFMDLQSLRSSGGTVRERGRERCCTCEGAIADLNFTTRTEFS
jgi:hypothetical protein